jgi:hypothetical protein
MGYYFGLWNWLELFTLKWCTREDGLLGHCKAKIWMGNPRLDSLLWDGRWMNWFVLRLRKEDSWWLLSRAVRLKAPKGGFVLIVVENDRVLWISAWCVEMEDLDFHSIELCCLFMSCRSYGRLSIASLWKRSHQEIPPGNIPTSRVSAGLVRKEYLDVIVEYLGCYLAHGKLLSSTVMAKFCSKVKWSQHRGSWIIK